MQPRNRPPCGISLARSAIGPLLTLLANLHTLLATEVAPVNAAEYFPPPESKGGWRTVQTEDQVQTFAEMDKGKIAELREWLLHSDDREFAAVVIRHGTIVLQVERDRSAVSDTGNVKSCAKAICATVLAIASEESQQGRTKRKMTFDDKAFDFIPWAQPLSDPRKAQITVKQLLNHTSGITPESTGVSNKGPWELILGHSGDARNQRLAFEPGSDLDYSTHALYHASLVCESVTGLPYDQFAIEHLLKPLGIEKWWFEFIDGDTQHGRHPSHAIGLPRARTGPHRLLYAERGTLGRSAGHSRVVCPRDGSTHAHAHRHQDFRA
jgi:CubicO group peptidase (beta-lactamase class C family)